jgi:DNA polymerase III delta subunit
VIDFIQDLPQFSSICKKWEAASKMRQWINDRKGQMSIKLEKEMRDAFIKQKPGEEKKDDNTEEIDSTANKVKA